MKIAKKEEYLDSFILEYIDEVLKSSLPLEAKHRIVENCQNILKILENLQCR